MANSIYYLMCIVEVEIHKKLNMAKDTFQACGRGGTSWSAMIKDFIRGCFWIEHVSYPQPFWKNWKCQQRITSQAPSGPHKVELIIGLKVLKVFKYICSHNKCLTLKFIYISLSDTVSKKFPATPRSFFRLLYEKK